MPCSLSFEADPNLVIAEVATHKVVALGMSGRCSSSVSALIDVTDIPSSNTRRGESVQIIPGQGPELDGYLDLGWVRLCAMTGRALLAWILREARYPLDCSPEQIAAAIGISARTVRRLEDPHEARRPRATTLRPIATFYGLDARFVEQLNSWRDLEGAALATAVRDQTAKMLDDSDPEPFAGAPDELRVLALRAAHCIGPERTTSTRTEDLFGPEVAQLLESLARSLSADDHNDLIRVLGGFTGLDRRRRRLLVVLLQDLAAARKLESGL
jgi:transcriptional regulator with XRE-family HTH domain